MKYVAEGCGGELLGGSPSGTIARVCTDSRQAQPGDLFIALAGDKFDGHDYVSEAAQKGAVAVVVQRTKVQSHKLGCAVIAVENPRQALGKLAARYRRDFHLPVIAVGGSNGKTTTKELLASVLRQRFETLWSEASFNNEIGVPLTLLKLDPWHEAAVLEAGTNHPGELAPLVRMIEPSSASSQTSGGNTWNFSAISRVSRKRKVGWRNCCRCTENLSPMATVRSWKQSSGERVRK